MSQELWTLGELAERVAGALSSGYDGQTSRRVAEVPEPRAIRYYTTLGLIDRPAAMRGRTALYGPRHLLQLVAIKRLQADGRTLAEIQTELAGAPDRTLRRIAAVPEEQFWKRAPKPRAPQLPGQPAPRSTPAPVEPVTSTETYQAVSLEGGALLLIPRRQALSNHDVAEIGRAASHLNAVIRRLSKGNA